MTSKKLLYICVTAVLVLAVLAIFTVTASTEVGDSSIYTVHPTDPGANFTTVQAAIDAASDGDSIEVWNSTYYEHVEVQKQVNKYTFDSEWGSYGTGDGEFDGPSGTAIGSNGKILVADKGNNRTQTIILNNVSNSFPMFSNATYANFTIGEDTIILTLDANASFDGVCNLTDLMGTEISAAGSYAEFEYFPTTYQNHSYDEKWGSAPYYDEAENKLYLLYGSGLLSQLNLYMGDYITDGAKFVGVGGLVGDFNITTEAEKAVYDGYNYLKSSISGVGAADLCVQFAPDSSYDHITFIPSFSQCEQLQFSVDTRGPYMVYVAHILGYANGAEPIPGVPLDSYLSLETNAEYFPITYQNHSYDEKWGSAPYYDETENKLYLLYGSGLLSQLNLYMGDYITDGAKFVGVGGLVGDFNITTEAEKAVYDGYNYLKSSISGVGAADLCVQFAPDSSYDHITFIPSFSQCEQLQFSVDTCGPYMVYVAHILGYANGAEPIPGVPLDSYLSLETNAEYFPITYQNHSYDQKWGSAPYYDETENKLYLLYGSGLLSQLNLYMGDYITDGAKFVGVGGLVGDFNITTEAEKAVYDGYNYLKSSISGVGAADLCVQFAPDSSYDHITFIPSFSQCEQLQFSVDTRGPYMVYVAHILGYANGAEPIPGVPLDSYLSLETNAEYFPITYQNHSYDQKWGSAPYYDETENKLYLLYGSGLLSQLNLYMGDYITDGAKFVGVGGLVGDFNITTEAEKAVYDGYNYLKSSISGVGNADLYAQYAPDTSFENVTFIPSFSQCEQLQFSVDTRGPYMVYVAHILGYANGAEYLTFDHVPLDNVAITGIFDLTYHPVNISGDEFDEKWSVEPEQYEDILVILSGTGTMTGLNFIFNDSTAAHPEISSYGYLRGDYNITANILPHYMAVVANGPDVAAMDVLDQGGFGVNFGEGPNCACGDICVNTTGWWRDGGAFHPSDTPIQAAIDDATIGETICVKDGIYNENVDVNTPLTIQSENGAASTIVNALNPNDHVFEVTADHVNIHGFSVQDATDKTGIYLYDADYCNIFDNKASNNAFGIFIESSSDCTVTNNIAFNYNSGIVLNSSSDCTVTSNTAFDNGFAGFGMGYSSNCMLNSNTAFNNEIFGIGLWFSSNNTFTSNNVSNHTLCDFRSSHDSHGNVVIDLTIASYPTTISFTYDNVSLKGVDTAPSDPEGKVNINKYVNVTGPSADSWISLDVSYSESDLGDVDENSLRMWKYDGTWTEVPPPNGVNTAENYVYANISSFSIFAPLGNASSIAPPEIISFAPPSPVNDTICTWRTFNVTVNQPVNVSWYLNDALQQTNESVQEARCRLHAEVAGKHNVTAIASNPNGTDMQTWIWNVTEESSFTFECSAGWNMISFPVDPLDKNADTIFGPEYYYLCTWDSDTGGYVPVDVVETEIGYWLLVLADRNVTAFGTQLSEYNTDITPGWNMIGSLWTATNVPGGTETVPADQMYPYLYTWCGDHYELTQDIGPGLGYWALAYVDCELHVFPAPPAAPLPLPQVLLGDNDWRVKLDVTSGAGTDVAEFGLHEDATDDFSAELDVPEPPSPPPSSTSPYQQVYFYDPENPLVKKLSTCYIPHHFVDDDDDDEYNSWLFRVEYSGDASYVTVTWNAEDINAVPAEYSLLFIADDEQIDMRTTPSYTFRAKTRTYEFEIRALTGGKKPDLVIEEEYEKGKAGRYTVFFVVKNIGTATAPEGHYATLYVDGVEIDEKLVSTDLEPGETYKGSFRTKVELTGKVENIKVCADSYNDVDELDEDNNCLKSRWQPVVEKPTMDKPPTDKLPTEKEAGLGD